MAEMYGRLILKQKQLIETLQQHTQQLVIQPSSSLLHVPVSLDDETLDESIAEGLSFATEKLDELDALRRLFNDNDLSKYEHYKARYERFQSQSFKNLEYDFESVPTHRKSPFAKRKQLQNQRLNLPDLPTTTIGSFLKLVKSVNLEQIGKIIALQMLSIKILQNEIARWIKIQEDIGLDVLVHGEFERNDMVEFLGKNFKVS